MLHDALEGFQKWIIRADYLPDNPMDTPRIKFTETIKSSRQIIDPRCKFVACGGKWTTVYNKKIYKKHSGNDLPRAFYGLSKFKPGRIHRIIW
jgi:hypothetical protein